jgi:hypothetical protein
MYLMVRCFLENAKAELKIFEIVLRNPAKALNYPFRVMAKV